MRKEKRQSIILREIDLHNKVLSVDLSEQLGVSDDTVRRDFKELAAQGKIIRVHGGAVSKSFVKPFNTDNQVYALEQKKIIAKKTKNLLNKYYVISTESGTAILELAKIIHNNMKITIITNSPQVSIS